MILVKGDLWKYRANVVFITTNGTLKKDGSVVMGKGCAKEATERYPGIAKVLGRRVSLHGNVPACLVTTPTKNIWSFPVKHNWWEEADPELIRKSAREVSSMEDRDFVLPRPGCGNGKLKWKDVKPILEKYLDDRFHVITYD